MWRMLPEKAWEVEVGLLVQYLFLDVRNKECTQQKNTGTLLYTERFAGRRAGSRFREVTGRSDAKIGLVWIRVQSRYGVRFSLLYIILTIRF